MKSQVLALAVLAIAAAGCGKKSSDDTAVAADSTQYTALKAIMVTSCSGAACHSVGGAKAADWYSSETSFKANLTSIQSNVASGAMPKTGTLTAAEKAKFAAYPN